MLTIDKHPVERLSDAHCVRHCEAYPAGRHNIPVVDSQDSGQENNQIANEFRPQGKPALAHQASILEPNVLGQKTL